MTTQKPLPAQVIRYAYLWHSEAQHGSEEGRKDRPCAIIMAVQDDHDRDIVTVLPITHTPPKRSEDAIEIPDQTKKRLGLDQERSWIVLTEANRFFCPGPDVRPINPKQSSHFICGFLPDRLFNQVRLQFIKKIKEAKAPSVTRTN